MNSTKTDQVTEALERLAAFREKVAFLENDFKEARDALLGPVLRKKMERLEAEHKDKLEKTLAKAHSLEGTIKECVLDLGETVKANGLAATHCTRVSWDDKMLLGFALAHPVIKKARSETNYVQIRTNKE